MHFEKIVFSLSPNTLELDAIRMAQPRHILISYPRWRNWSLSRLFERIGYQPNIMVDSGAYTYYKQGLTITELRQREDLYTAWLIRNRHYYSQCLVMESFRNPRIGMYSFMRLHTVGLRPIPVVHPDQQLEYGIDWYQRWGGIEWVALGGTARDTDRNQPGNFRKRVLWASQLINDHPTAKFHLLGTQDENLIYRIPGLKSVDGTTWIHAGRYRAQAGEDRLEATVDEIRKRETALTNRIPHRKGQLQLF